MSRYQIEIRNGGNGPAQWGAVVALVVLVVYAAAGNHRIAAMLHVIESAAVITAASAVGVGVLALIVIAACRRARAARRAAWEQALIAANRAYYLGTDPARREIDAPRLPDWPPVVDRWSRNRDGAA